MAGAVGAGGSREQLTRALDQIGPCPARLPTRRTDKLQIALVNTLMHLKRLCGA